MGEYTIKDTPSGFRTLLHTGPGGREVRLHSAYDPMREAERSAGTFMKGRASLIIVCGLGLGYHVRALKERFPGCVCIVLERDRTVTDLARSAYPRHLDGVGVIHDSADLSPLFEAMDFSTFLGAATFIHRPSYSLDQAFYDGLMGDIRQYLSSKLSDLLTRFEFEERWMENILRNVRHVFTSVPVGALFGKFRNYPGIIVSAGPSLRKNVHQLRLLRNRALIVCVDTAYRVLQRSGVAPHIVMTLDAQRYSMKHFIGTKDDGAWLLADLVSFPRILDGRGGPKIISTTSKFYTGIDGSLKRETTPLMDWVEQYIRPVGDIQSGGSVATSVFDFLLNLGCSPIILVGQDLAYTGREIHCSGTYHNDEWLARTTRFLNLDTINQDVIRKRKIKRVQAFGGEGTVVSDFVFDLYKGWFEDSAAKVGVPVINATEGGARIRNMEESALADIFTRLPIPIVNPAGVLDKVLTERRSDQPALLLSRVILAMEKIAEIRRLTEGRESGSGVDDEILARLATEGDAGKILIPFLKKTFIYLARHEELDPERASRLYFKEVLAAAKKIERLLGVCRDGLDRISPS